MAWIVTPLCIIAFIFGLLLGKRQNESTSVGTLRIEHSEPDEPPLLFLELSTDPRFIMRENKITLDVNTKSYLSHD